MFWSKKNKEEKVEKLSAPKEIPEIVKKYLVGERKMDPDLARVLKATLRNRSNGEKGVSIRIFDESEALAKKEQVKDYTSLDEHPDLIIYEGWFNDESKHVELEEKKKVGFDTPIFTEAEIRQKIEGLSQPGSTVFFYLARGPGHGGPLGMGCAIVELNPNYTEKKQKKYILYTTDVVDMQPVGKGQELLKSDKSKDMSRWIKEAHHKRMY